MRSLWICLVVATAACTTHDETARSSEPAASDDPVAGERGGRTKETLVIAVRHAERGTDNPADPSLSEAGRARAQALAGVLDHTDITAIFTSQFARTRETAAPLAEATGVEIQVRPVDATNLATYSADLAGEIQRGHRRQAVLVVGHSNTIPELVEALSGVVVPPITEPEFDRLYTITLGSEVRVIAAKY